MTSPLETSGATGEGSAQEAEASAAALAVVRRVAIGLVWRCELCGYQRWSISRPAACPGCEAPGERFTGLSAVEWRRRDAG